MHDVGPYLSRKANKPLVLQRELAGNSRGQKSCVKSAASPVSGCSWPQCVAVVFFFSAHLMGPTSFKRSAVACSPARPPRQDVHLEVFKSSVPSRVLIFCFLLLSQGIPLVMYFSEQNSCSIPWLPVLDHSAVRKLVNTCWKKKRRIGCGFFTQTPDFS